MDAAPLVVLAGSLVGACVYGYLIRAPLAECCGAVNVLQKEAREKDEELLRLKGEQRMNRKRIEELRFIQYGTTGRQEQNLQIMQKKIQRGSQ